MDRTSRKVARRKSKREAAEAIVSRLREAGHVALFAGGCVRDLLLHTEPKDYDVATDAVPERIVQLFRRTQQVGAKFGVVIVHESGHMIEVATFRSDGDYADGRHPQSVHFSDPVQDARRRDFTINGMFLDPTNDEVIDHVGGLGDLERHLIRAIGDPRRRFAEDHLRMLRGVRFAARLGFEIEPATAAAIRDAAESIRSISAERVRAELLMILTAPSRRRGWELLRDVDLSVWIVPDTQWTDAEAADVAARLATLPARCSDVLALATVLRKYDPPAAAARCRALTCSNLQVNGVRWLLGQLPRLLDCAAFEPADFKLLLAEPLCDDLLHLGEAEIGGRNLSPEPLTIWKKRTAAIRPEDVSPPRLVTGDDLTTLGLDPGPAFAKILAKLYRLQLNGLLSNREQALVQARKLTGDP